MPARSFRRIRLTTLLCTLTLSIPATPRLRLTLRNAVSMRVSVILPVNECALIFATRRSFPAELLETTDGRFGPTSPWRMFLSVAPAVRGGSGVPNVGSGVAC